MAGFIKVHRDIQQSSFWSDAKKVRWWLELNFWAAISDRPVRLRGGVLECKRGQCVRSLTEWAKEWRTTKKSVHSFFLQLEDEGWIIFETFEFGTRITICDRDDYQSHGYGQGIQRGTKVQRKRNRKETPKDQTNPSESNNSGQFGNTNGSSANQDGTIGGTPTAPYIRMEEGDTENKQQKNTESVLDSQEPLINPNRSAHCPTWKDVEKVMLDNGGSLEQARSFFEFNEVRDWRIKAAPIIFWQPLVSKWLEKSAIAAATNARRGRASSKQNGIGDEQESTPDEQNSGNGTKPDNSNELAEKEGLFSSFFEVYGKKVKRDAALKAWMQIDLTEMSTIIDKAKAFAATIKDPTYQPHAATWLSEKRWEDEFSARASVSDGKPEEERRNMEKIFHE
jgi:hypothetical protein